MKFQAGVSLRFATGCKISLQVITTRNNICVGHFKIVHAIFDLFLVRILINQNGLDAQQGS